MLSSNQIEYLKVKRAKIKELESKQDKQFNKCVKKLKLENNEVAKDWLFDYLFNQVDEIGRAHV